MDKHGRLVAMTLNPGQDSDGPHGRQLLETFSPGEIEYVVTDNAYDGDGTRQRVRKLKAKACLKLPRTAGRGNATTRFAIGTETKWNDSSTGSNSFANRIKPFRHIATRYEKPLENLAGLVWIAALMVNVL